MSIHRSLKTKPSALNQHRNVLKRSERIARLQEKDKFDPANDSPIGLPKVISRQAAAIKKKKAAAAEGEGEATEAEG